MFSLSPQQQFAPERLHGLNIGWIHVWALSAQPTARCSRSFFLFFFFLSFFPISTSQRKSNAQFIFSLISLISFIFWGEGILIDCLCLGVCSALRKLHRPSPAVCSRPPAAHLATAYASWKSDYRQQVKGPLVAGCAASAVPAPLVPIWRWPKCVFGRPLAASCGNAFCWCFEQKRGWKMVSALSKSKLDTRANCTVHLIVKQK